MVGCVKQGTTSLSRSSSSSVSSSHSQRAGVPIHTHTQKSKIKYRRNYIPTFTTNGGKGYAPFTACPPFHILFGCCGPLQSTEISQPFQPQTVDKSELPPSGTTGPELAKIPFDIEVCDNLSKSPLSSNL